MRPTEDLKRSRAVRTSSLTLARFEAGGDSSKGRWLVRELPGVALMRHKKGKWKIHVGLAILTATQESQEKTWGKGWSSRADRLYMRLGCMKFRTRDEALEALESITSEAPAGRLSELL